MSKDIFRVSRPITLHLAGINVPGMVHGYVVTLGLQQKEQGSRKY